MVKEEEIKQRMQQFIGITDEDFQTHISYLKNLKLAERGLELRKYKIIAEVKESKYCSAGLKPGQKYTFNTFPAMLRIVEGVDPNKGMWHMAECLDPGVARGGLGHVVFRVYALKIE